jgi:hypothetical protein
MSDNKMSPELQIAIRRSPEYTQPSAELVTLRAEVAAWRGAVRWWRMGGDWELRVGVRGSPVGIGWVGERRNGWSVGAVNFASTGGLPDRDTACRKVCELLGLPVVLP